MINLAALGMLCVQWGITEMKNVYACKDNSIIVYLNDRSVRFDLVTNPYTGVKQYV
jgi:hypothetical protein